MNLPHIPREQWLYGDRYVVDKGLAEESEALAWEELSVGEVFASHFLASQPNFPNAIRLRIKTGEQSYRVLPYEFEMEWWDSGRPKRQVWRVGSQRSQIMNMDFDE